MQKNRIALAAAAFCGIVAAPAMALPLSSYVAGADTLEVRISGASAQDIALEKAMAEICVSGSLNGASYTNQSVYYCSINPTQVSGLSTNVTKLVLYKTSVGGSTNGTTPVANAQTTLGFINLSTLAANAATCLTPESTFGGAVPVYSMAGIVAGTCQSTATGTAPDIGIADVEPALLGISAAVRANLIESAGSHLTFAVPVTVTLRDQLQALQGKTVGSDLAIDTPSLSKAQLTSIYNGTITNWSELGLSSGPINIARRSDGSGTTRTFNAYFGVTGICSPGALVERLANTGDTTGACASDNGTIGLVMAGAGTDNVVACLNNHNSGGRRAIGRLSTETSTGPGTAGAGFRFIAIDSVLPTLVNVANGNYGLWASTTYLTRSAAAPGGVLTGDKAALSSTLQSKLGSKNVLQDVNAGIVQTFAPAGQVGYLARPLTRAAAVTLPANFGLGGTGDLSLNPTNPFQKGTPTATNNCQQGRRIL